MQDVPHPPAKKINCMGKYFFSLSILLFFFFGVRSQSMAPEKSLDVLKKNIVKVNLSAIAVEAYTIQYEHVVNKAQSIALTVGLSPNVPLPFKQTLLNDFKGNSDARRAIETTVFSKYTATLEYRFYFSGNAPKGFYFAPFARYMNMKIGQDYTFTPSDGLLHHAHMNGKFDGIGAGFLLGDQFLIGKNWAIDWWIIGPFYGSNITADFIGTDPMMGDMSQQDLDNLKNNIESVKLPLYKTSATVTPSTNTVEAKLVGPYFGLRAMGVCLAYRF